jgi:hypothetical protein
MAESMDRFSPTLSWAKRNLPITSTSVGNKLISDSNQIIYHQGKERPQEEPVKFVTLSSGGLQRYWWGKHFEMQWEQEEQWRKKNERYMMKEGSIKGR